MHRNLYIQRTDGFKTTVFRIHGPFAQIELYVTCGGRPRDRRAGLNPEHLSRIERGFFRPHQATLRRLENELKVQFEFSERKNIQKVSLAQGIAVKDKR